MAADVYAPCMTVPDWIPEHLRPLPLPDGYEWVCEHDRGPGVLHAASGDYLGVKNWVQIDGDLFKFLLDHHMRHGVADIQTDHAETPDQTFARHRARNEGHGFKVGQ